MLPLAALLIADAESAFYTKLFFSAALFSNASALLPLLHCLCAVATALVQPYCCRVRILLRVATVATSTLQLLL
jgi:hypothetical protein